MISKKNLIDGRWYVGTHRNADIATWDAKKLEFHYPRYKLGTLFFDTAKHPEDDDGLSLFYPFELVRKPTDEEIESVIEKKY